ncbi:MAG: hypothetical protein FJZ01_12945 [Candidatus Sericytochromatia bacterium]|nr:hypothetical protein [Candidatus Tanganyikabacteria bacterium]
MQWEALYGRPATDLEGYALETFHAAFRAARKMFIWPDVPPAALAEARASFLTTEADDLLIALADAAAMGHGGHLGFAVTTRALWWRNIGQAPATAAFASLPDPVWRGTWLEFGPAGAIDVQAVDGAMIEALQIWARDLAAATREGVPWDFVRGWHVRHKDDARGPYTWREVEALLRSGALLPYTSEARGPGLADWTPMVRIDEVKGILSELKSAESAAEPVREASRRVTARPQEDEAPVKVAKPRKPATAPAKKEKTVGQMIDGLIASVRKRFGG